VQCVAQIPLTPFVWIEVPNKNIEIVWVDYKSPLLDDVIRLADVSSSTLGFYPRGAFRESAKRRQILAAVDTNGILLGYLLFRISNFRLMIVHLCIDKAFRHHGIAKQLVERLAYEHSNLLKGIGLNCRRDYEATDVWPKLGFKPICDKPGRSRKGSILTYWWRDFRTPTLFSDEEQRKLGTAKKAVVDANAFFSFRGSDPQSEEAKGLLADWLVDYFAICLTDEIFVEINRHHDGRVRDEWRAYAREFPCLGGTPQEIDKAVAELTSIFGKAKKPSDLSDTRHLAHAIVNSADFFVTSDGNLLDSSNEIFEKFGIGVVRSSELIQDIDRLIHSSEYQPSRVAGTQIESIAIKTDEIDDLVTQFIAHENEEKGNRLAARVRELLSKPHEYKSHVIKDREDKVLGLVFYGRIDKESLSIPLFRVRRGPLGATLTSFFVEYSIQIARVEQRSFVEILDENLDPAAIRYLAQSGFIDTGHGHTKVVLMTSASINGVIDGLKSRKDGHTEHGLLMAQLANWLEEIKNSPVRTRLAAELNLWPAKFSDLELPSFIVPIKPFWAMHLFDHAIGSQHLFGANPKLALNPENAYYRSSKPAILLAPGRVLWYVSRQDGYAGSGSVRACSYLQDLVVDTPKAVFRRFRHFGIYEWKNIRQMVQNDLSKKIMAFRFSHTELALSPMSVKTLRQVFRNAEAKEISLQSPVRITTKTFFAIYESLMKG
jgi:GNAT superfamily N-acetyltransferase